MRVLLVILFFVAFAVAIDSQELLFKEWAANFSRVYSSDAEYQKRFGIWRSNVKHINEFNAEGHTYTLGINQFTDLTNEEFKANFRPFPVPKNTGNVKVHTYDPNVAVPTSWNWATQGAVTAVKNQGQCGSCWSFSATGAIEGLGYIQTKQLIGLSEQQLVDCSGAQGDQGCNGGWYFWADDYVKANGGLCTETAYPYVSGNGQVTACTSSQCSSSPNSMVGGYTMVQTYSDSALMQAVYQQPVSVAIEADQSSFQSYSSGVFTGPCGTNIDHAVLVVGYDTTSSPAYWIVKNSWGSSWGDQGYIYMAQGMNLCGINEYPSYPTWA